VGTAETEAEVDQLSLTQALHGVNELEDVVMNEQIYEQQQQQQQQL